MKTFFRYAATVAVTGVLALAAASPSEARYGRNAAAIGLGVGAVVAGAAIANSAAYNNGYYGYYGDPGYAYEPGYAYGGYAYDPYADSYAYAPAPVYGYGYRYGYGDRWQRQHRTNNFSIDSQR